MFEYALDRTVLADELERARGADVLDTLREVRAEEKREVDVTRAVELQDCANVGAGDEDERATATGYVADEGGFVDEDVLGIRVSKCAVTLVGEMICRTVSSLAT